MPLRFYHTRAWIEQFLFPPAEPNSQDLRTTDSSDFNLHGVTECWREWDTVEVLASRAVVYGRHVKEDNEDSSKSTCQNRAHY